MNNNPYFNYYSYPNFQNMNFRSVPSSFVGNSLRGPGAAFATRSPGLLSRLFAPASSVGAGITGATKTFSFSNLLNGASKTLGVINQAIPVVTQVKPIINNAKTMFRVAKAMSSSDSVKTNNDTTISKNETAKEEKENISSNNNGPTFFA